jgi:hypothetical protein
MNAAAIARKITMLETTISTSADVMSPEAIAKLKTLRDSLVSMQSGTVTIDAARGAAAHLDGMIASEPGTHGRTALELTAEVLREAVAVATEVEPVAVPVVDVTVTTSEPATADPLSREFITAGRAIFTISNGRGERFTFKVTKPEDRFRGEYFASVMKGSDNESDYKYCGMMSGERFTLRATKGSKFGADTKEFKVLAFALDVIAGRRALPAGYELLHAGKCGRCARTLTTPESIKRGIGPECFALMGLSAAA